jgi:glyoxylase-like metal-dependent hydrolase (beta-lactamase superfamily II)
MEKEQPTRIRPLVEAKFGLDGGAMFGIIPQPLWSKTNPPDDRNRIELATRCVLLQYESRNVLIDVGIGTKWSEDERDIYKIDDQDAQLVSALGNFDLSPTDIDDVILTHLHFDHAGGVSRFARSGDAAEQGEVVASFPEATHWVQKRNWSWANAPSARDAGSYRSQDFRFFEEREEAPPLELVDGIDEIMPGVEVLPQHGHTFGMQVVKITTEDHTFAYLADLVPTTSHMRDPYVMGYDLQPLETVEEKRELLHRAAREDWILIFEHDPSQGFARVEFDGDTPKAAPVDVSNLPTVASR